MPSEKKYTVVVADPGFYPPELVDIARRRTEDLLSTWNARSASISTLIESAYLIGVMDAISAKRKDDDAK